MSPRMVLRKKKAHCLEGALLAAVALWLQGEKPLVMNCKTLPGDDDHALTLYRVNGYWGAISKTNHSILRFRDPIYRSVHELAVSYFHEYFLSKNGKKTFRYYSKPLNLRRFGTKWITSEKDVWDIAYALADTPHLPLVPPENKGFIRNAVPFERRMIEHAEWKKSDPRT